jgi:hypothetical protein
VAALAVLSFQSSRSGVVMTIFLAPSFGRWYGSALASRPPRVQQAVATVLAVLGFRADREGFTTIEADAPLPLAPPAPRPDGAAPFSSALPAGDRAGLRSLVTPQELLALALLARAAAAA